MRITLRIFSVAFVLLGLLGCTSTPGGGKISEPSGKGPFPAIIVLHTSGGLRDHEKNYARKLSGQGYVATAVDWSSGGGTNITDAYEYLITRPDVDPERIGLVGFSKGALSVLWLASRLSLMQSDYQISGVVSYYIGHSIVHWIKPLKHPPTLFLHGDQDLYVEPIEIINYCQERKENNVVCEYEIYEGAKHAFTHQTKYRGYDKIVAAAAWNRALAFLDMYVKRESQ
jgi:dienelactone hydrolase